MITVKWLTEGFEQLAGEQTGCQQPYAPPFMALLLISMMCDIGLRRVSPMMDHLLAVAMRAVGMMRPFSRSFASWPVESAYAGERPVHHAPQLSWDGRLLVLPWSSPLKGSLEYAKKTMCDLVTFAHCKNISW